MFLQSGAEGEDDEETLAADLCGSPMKIIRNDLSPQTHSVGPPLRLNDPSTSRTQPSTSGAQPSTSGAQPSKSTAQPSTSAAADFYGLNLQQTKETFYKDVPSSSKNFNLDNDVVKCTKDDTQHIVSEMDSLNLQSRSKIKRNEMLNNGRRYSESSAQKNNNVQVISSSVVAGSRFKTTPVAEDLLRPGTSNDSANKNEAGPLVTKAKNSNIKPGFTISET